MQKKNSLESVKGQAVFRYDKIEISIKWALGIENKWYRAEKTLFEQLKSSIDDGRGIRINSGPPQKSKYKSYKSFESSTQRIEVFYGRFRTEIDEMEKEPLWAYIRLSCKDKENGYGDHCKTILNVERILRSLKFQFHLRHAELCLDFSNRELYDWFFQRILFAWARGCDYRYWEQTTNRKGDRVKGFDPSGQSMFAKEKTSPRELTMYIKTERGITRHRLEMLLSRNYLWRKRINRFAQLVAQGPEFLLRHISLREFSLQKILYLHWVYKAAGACQKFHKKSKKFFQNLVEKPSAQILAVLSDLLHGYLPQYEIKQRLSSKIPFPPIFVNGQPLTMYYK
jgi:hypothetical protein